MCGSALPPADHERAYRSRWRRSELSADPPTTTTTTADETPAR